MKEHVPVLESHTIIMGDGREPVSRNLTVPGSLRINIISGAPKPPEEVVWPHGETGRLYRSRLFKKKIKLLASLGKS